MINHIIWASGLLAHLLLLFVLLRRNHASDLPSFTLLVLFYAVRSVGLVMARHFMGHPVSVVPTLLLDGIDVLLQCAVLAELTWIALKPLSGKRRLLLPLLMTVSGLLIVSRLSPHRSLSLPSDLVFAHFLLSVLMVEWAVMLAFLLGPLHRCWRSPVAAVSFGFGVYSTVLLAGGGYFTTGRQMRDYIVFSYLRIIVYLLVVLFWAISLWLSRRETA